VFILLTLHGLYLQAKDTKGPNCNVLHDCIAPSIYNSTRGLLLIEEFSAVVEDKMGYSLRAFS
jgi:hypothetical protein